MSKEYAEVIIAWGKMAKTRYDDDIIRKHIDKSCMVGENQAAQAEAQVALAMIFYNEMINNRIINAKKMWDIK